MSGFQVLWYLRTRPPCMNPPCDFKKQRDGPASSVRTKPHSRTPCRAFHRCSDAITSFRCGPVDEESELELPLREAFSSLSSDIGLSHEPRELLSSAHSRESSLFSSPRLSPRNAIPGARTALALFSATQPTSPPAPEIRRRTTQRGSRAARCVSSSSLFLRLRFLFAVWCK